MRESRQTLGQQGQLDQIARDIVVDKICPELASSATQLVMGVGNPSADIVFVGEAPGRQEDEQGEPFVGRSGQMLDSMLESIKLKRSQVYITNIVKYRPPGNRDPSPEEKQAFLPYLVRQLNVIKPKLVVTLGRHSGMVFLPELQISRDHGQPRRFRRGIKGHLESYGDHSWQALNLVVLPLYHPAAALYNGSLRQTLEYDFAKIPIILKKLTTRNTLKK